MRGAAYVCLLSSIAIAPLTAQSHQAQPERPLTVAQIVRQTSDSVVQVVLLDESGEEFALGSGFIVSPDGKIVTNFHVIKGAHTAIAKLANGSFFPVDGALAADADRDLAVLKVGARGLPFLTLAPTAGLQVGDHVVAIGSPLGLEGTVSDGIVSAFRDKTPNKKLIQTTAPVSHGNSGGPLLNMRGMVVGVVSSGVSPEEGQNLNFAIPSEDVKSLLAMESKLTPIDVAGRNQSTVVEQAQSRLGPHEQHAAEQLRAIAQAIEDCSPDTDSLPVKDSVKYKANQVFSKYLNSIKSAGFVWQHGPPTDVVWGVAPAHTVSAGYLGTIEYELPWWEKPPSLDDYCYKSGGLVDRTGMSKANCEDLWQQAFEDYQRNIALPEHYRYEFALTADGLFFLRAFEKKQRKEGEPWVAEGIDVNFCGYRAILLVLGETVGDAPR